MSPPARRQPSNTQMLRSMNRGACPESRRAASVIEVVLILVVGLLIIGLAFLLLPPRSPSRALSPRTVCAANLKGIGTGLYTYAYENDGWWPVALHAPAEADHVGKVRYAPGMIGTHREDAEERDGWPTTTETTDMSTTRNFWVLVRIGASSPKSMICPSSDDEPNDVDNPQDFWDFRKYSEISYGYQVPYGRLGRPNVDADARMALAADKGPFGKALETGSPIPGIPTPGITDSWRKWAPWNSPNHGGEGQNVLYPDGHADFVTTPLAGVEHDNIYTRWSDATGGTPNDWTPRIHGTPPTGIETPWGNTDSFIYP